MSDKDQREASLPIEVFGNLLVSKAYSKTWSFREDALLEVYKEMQSLADGTSPSYSKSMLRAAIFLIAKAIKDQVFAVFTACLNLLRLLLMEYVPKYKIGKSDVQYAIEKTLPNLLQKSADTAIRNREAAKNFIIEESKFVEVKPLNVVPHECVKPFKRTVPPRQGLSRCEIVYSLYKQHGLQSNEIKLDGLTVENVMNFCNAAIEHHAGEVREQAEKIIVHLYRDVGSQVKEYLPPDDEKTRKNVLYKQMFEEFDKIDGKPTKNDLKKQKQNTENEKKREIEALQNQLKDLREMAAQQKATTAKPADDKKDSKVKKKERPGPPPQESANDEDANTLLQIDQTCIFCSEKNADFTEEGLDLHYWKSCPMLKRCSYCKQVVEIAGLTDHLLTECDSKGNFQKCPRCTEAILKTDFAQHSANKNDAASEAGKSHCPLCHENLAAGDDSWKKHLMTKDGCKQNPRRLQALAKNKKGDNKSVAKGPSKTGVKPAARK